MYLRTSLFALFASLLLGGAGAVSAAEADRPNILLVFLDDMSYEGLGAAGLTDIETPNLDRLAALGAHLTCASNMGSWSGAVCVASRTMLVTGRSVWRAHAVYDHTDDERKAGRLWPQLMHQAGYQTFFTGKWHVRADAMKVFDVARNIRGGMPKQTKAEVVRLYHVADDPKELHDLAADPAQAQRVKGLFARLLALQEALDDTLDLRAAFPVLNRDAGT